MKRVWEITKFTSIGTLAWKVEKYPEETESFIRFVHEGVSIRLSLDDLMIREIYVDNKGNEIITEKKNRN